MDEKDLIKQHEDRNARINKIAESLKGNSNEFVASALPDGSIQSVGKTINHGKPVFTVAKDDKNVMTFASKKQLLEYLGDDNS